MFQPFLIAHYQNHFTNWNIIGPIYQCTDKFIRTKCMLLLNISVMKCIHKNSIMYGIVHETGVVLCIFSVLTLFATLLRNHTSLGVLLISPKLHRLHAYVWKHWGWSCGSEQAALKSVDFRDIHMVNFTHQLPRRPLSIFDVDSR